MILPPLLANMTAFTAAYAQSDFFGRVILLSLIGISLISWVFLIQKVYLARKVKALSIAFEETFEKNRDQLFQLDTRELSEGRSSLIPHPFAKIFEELKGKATDIINKNVFFAKERGSPTSAYLSPSDLEVLEAHLLTVISSQKKLLEKNLFILSTIVTLGPFLGLLGTVWGILVTFAELHLGGSVGSNAAVLGGISTALATTVLGLIIAIPALISYNYLKSALGAYASDMEDFCYRLLSSVELQYRRVE